VGEARHEIVAKTSILPPERAAIWLRTDRIVHDLSAKF
jgi:hypothetical protein